jgi:hypothetical protein
MTSIAPTTGPRFDEIERHPDEAVTAFTAEFAAIAQSPLPGTE